MVQREKYVCIVGGATVDICGTPFSAPKMRDSNPGQILVTAGGVGRNIAENLARLGVKVVFITVFGNDDNSRIVLRSAEECGVDLSHSLQAEGETSTYLCVNDERNDMYLALSDMRILRHLTPEYLHGKLDVLNGAACVVADTNLPHCLDFLQRNVTVPIFLDTVSAKKTEAVKDALFRLFYVKPNVYEAEVLSGERGATRRAAEKIRAKGVENVVITDGAEGAYFLDGERFLHFPAVPSEIKSTTGAGDSFTAGVVYAWLQGKKTADCISYGCAASSITVASPRTVSDQMSAENIEKIAERCHYATISENIR